VVALLPGGGVDEVDEPEHEHIPVVVGV
jgi:hypothetical protein